MRQVIAIAIADIHLSMKPPIYRAVEPDWIAAQLRCFQKLKAIKEHYEEKQKNSTIPILCAGDVFHKYYEPVELVNRIINFGFPQHFYSIVGNHDLPYHNLKDIERSAFWNLHLSNELTYCGRYKNQQVYKMLLSGFDYGKPIIPNTPTRLSMLKVALCHKYIWKEGHTFPNADPTGNIYSKEFRDSIKGYDVVIFGDNHSSFTDIVDNVFIVNCGAFIPRNSNESFDQTNIHLIYDDGIVKSINLKDEQAKFQKVKEEEQKSQSLEWLVQELNEISANYTDFRHMCEQSMQKMFETFDQRMQKYQEQTKETIAKILDKAENEKQ